MGCLGIASQAIKLSYLALRSLSSFSFCWTKMRASSPKDSENQLPLFPWRRVQLLSAVLMLLSPLRPFLLLFAGPPLLSSASLQSGVYSPPQSAFSQPHV